MPASLAELSADVLVIGGGLAGLRAALAALEAGPALRVILISSRDGPSGSSFANLHGRLGMQVCFEPEQSQNYLDEALTVAAPGYADPGLVAILARESLSAFKYLQDLGAAFELAPEGGLARHSGCFSPLHRRAVVLNKLPELYQLLHARFLALGGQSLSGLCLAALCVPGETRGALFVSEDSAGPWLASCKSLVLALGGAAALYKYNLAGPGNPGFGLGLMHRAGLKLLNQAYLQFMWSCLPAREFFSPARLAEPGLRVLAPDGKRLNPAELIPNIDELAAKRATHCPFGHGQADAVLDKLLAANLGPDACVKVADSQGHILNLAPLAHASNGGAWIDERAATSLPGIFACGECASGMHGANRIGGGMVAATQVFGARAGTGAAKFAQNAGQPDKKLLREAARSQAAQLRVEHKAYAQGKKELAENTQKYCVLSGREGLADFAASQQDEPGACPDWRLGLLRQSAGIIAAAQAGMSL